MKSWIALFVLTALVVSFLSGLELDRMGYEELLPFSPWGILTRPLTQLIEVTDSCHFVGRWSWNFDYFFVYLRTVFLELPFYFYLLRKEKVTFRLFALTAANLATHPIVFFLFPCFSPNLLFQLVASELFAPLLEIGILLWMRCYFGLNLSKLSIVVAVVIANLCSWQMGIFLF